MKKLSSPIDLIKKSFEIFFKRINLIYFAKIYSVLLPFSIFSLFQGYFVNPETMQPKNVWFTVLIIVVNVAAMIANILVGVAGIEAVSRAVKGEKLDIKSTFIVGKNKFWKYLLLVVLLALIIGFGFILLIVPGILFLVWFSFSTFILIEEKVGVKQALVKSKELVKGKFWRVLGRVLSFGIFSTVVMILTSLLPYNLGVVLTVFLEALFILPSYLLYKELTN